MTTPCSLPLKPASPVAPRRLYPQSGYANTGCIRTISFYPVFVCEGEKRREDVASMPGVARLSLDGLLPVAEQCVALGIPYLALFPVIDAGKKDAAGSEATNPEGLIPKVVQALKQRFPELGIMTRYGARSLHQPRADGIPDASGHLMNDATIAQLQKQALCQAQAGVGMVAPSDMMDGRIGAIRQALDAQGLIDTRIHGLLVPNTPAASTAPSARPWAALPAWAR